jgi:hypothetical protein
MDENTVKSMYGIKGNSGLDLTPEKFEAINNNKKDLKRIRESLKKLKKTTVKKKLMQNLKETFADLKNKRLENEKVDIVKQNKINVFKAKKVSS